MRPAREPGYRLRKLRSRLLSSLASALEEYMRSAAFLESMQLLLQASNKARALHARGFDLFWSWEAPARAWPAKPESPRFRIEER